MFIHYEHSIFYSKNVKVQICLDFDKKDKKDN